MKKNNRNLRTAHLVALAITAAGALSGCATADSCLTAVTGTSGASTIANSGMHGALLDESGFAVVGKQMQTPVLQRGITVKPFSTSRLHSLAGSLPAKQATVFIGGIHDSYHYFEHWADAMAAPGRIVLGWEHDHRAMPMAQSLALFVADLSTLKNAGISNITIVAQSLGGLVAKGAIDRLAETGQAQKFNRLVMHAMGTPWGGYAVLEYASYVPGSTILSTFFGYPMANELAPGSDYLIKLGKALPANAELHLYTGEEDHIALPERSITKRRYAAIESRAASVTTIRRFRHNDYNKSPLLASLTRKTMPPCDGTPCKQVVHAEVSCAASDFTLGQAR